MSQIDINELAKNPKLNLTITSSEDETPKDAQLRRFKDLILFTVSLVLILSVFFFCSYTLMSAQTSADNKKWAMAIASSIVAAFLGYLTGKNLNQ